MKNVGKNAGRLSSRDQKNRDLNEVINKMNNFYVPATTTEKDYVHYKYLLDQITQKTENR
ncbi:hypothetical protein KMW28_21375 [Flammeovirga yaeyamensis]|uniref:Uncharacterized protein n=1 Tax=Flammeovirga yaeyamensis TaxID=367791 RepID=A0AAX1NE97_9BACT|nr:MULTISPECIES: hypothetical protein [Flammeovirga]ANQ52715.1 hypothetical protein MY04_5383 [Flammeovirga sp. MY04]MBB3697096.1 hypothetical protein [Flammeovirga yaeyamensis]NMF33758.1 hypothetical protein [Flammeovirga yaeyamensis]QWG04976.1 hypothetical protein KMW28_21375 [Flammeovirga yaeyamensis]